MRSLRISVVLGAIFAAVFLTSGFPTSASAQANPQPKAQGKVSSLTGCIDEDNGRYILVDDRELQPIADLEADGFPTESFAKHLGEKVIVRGISSSGDTRPRMKVRSIETVSKTCASQQHL